jgi:regulator of microtubule dynamics protein 3
VKQTQSRKGDIFRPGILFLLAFFWVATCRANDLELLLREASHLKQEHRSQEALLLYEEVLGLDPLQQEALWQASLLLLHRGSLTSDETSKGEDFKKAEKYSRKALEVAPENPAATFALASSLLHLCQIASIRQKLHLLKEAKQYLDQVLVKNPLHADAWHLLGRWHFRAANYNLSELLLASFYMREVSRKASNQEAILAMEMAITLEPANILYYHDLARVLQEKKQTLACQQILQKALLLEVITVEDAQISRKCKTMLGELRASAF